jgi:hypothetical protein
MQGALHGAGRSDVLRFPIERTTGMNVRVHMREFFATWDYFNVGSIEDDKLDHVEVRDRNGEALAAFLKSDMSWIEVRV